MLPLFMVIGFLDILQEEGRIDAVAQDGLLHYYDKNSSES